MNITWYGQTCFRIIAQKSRNGSVNLLIDPLGKESGLRSPKLDADILLFTRPEGARLAFGDSPKAASNEKIASGNYFLVTGPGEYDVKGVYIQGIAAQTQPRKEEISKENNIYTVEAEGIKICHLGKFAQKELTPDQLKIINEVDILMIPIGGGEVVDSAEAVKIMAQIEPKIIIPMYYRIPKLKIKLDTLDKFLKALGVKTLESLPKLSVKKEGLSAEIAKIIVLKP